MIYIMYMCSVGSYDFNWLLSFHKVPIYPGRRPPPLMCVLQKIQKRSNTIHPITCPRSSQPKLEDCIFLSRPKPEPKKKRITYTIKTLIFVQKYPRQNILKCPEDKNFIIFIYISCKKVYHYISYICTYIFLHNIECSSPIANDHVLIAQNVQLYNVHICRYLLNIIETIIAYIYIAYESCML